MLNFLLKYADDSTLFCPELSSVPVEDEMKHIMEWARLNKMILNLRKTVEIVFHRPNLNHDILPPALPDVDRVTTAKLLGVYLTSDLKFTEYISSVVTVCNQRLYLLSQLKKQGLGVFARDAVFAAIILSKIMYAMPALYGYLTERDKNHILSVFAKAQRWHLIAIPPDFELICAGLQFRLFQQSLDGGHCLNHLYTPKSRDPDAMILRKRGHDFVLPSIKHDFNRQPFIARVLYAYR
jgi:hypothetical protein